MARRGIGEGIIAASQGFFEGFKTGKTLQDMAAERALKKRQFELDVEKSSAGQTILGADGKVYQTSGISPEAKGRLLGTPATPSIMPGAMNLGTGKITIQKPPQTEEEVTNVSVDEFNADPDAFRTKKIKIVPSTKKGGMNPAQQFSLFTAKELYKQYLNQGDLNQAQINQLKDATANLDLNLIPEEEQGILYGVQKYLAEKGVGERSFQPKVSKGKTAPAPKAAAPGKIRVKDKKSGQTGTIDAAEFNETLYEKL